MGRKKKERYCRCCGAVLGADRAMICEPCQAAGFGARLSASEYDGKALLDLARERERCGIYPLAEYGMEEINALARMFRAPYGTYGSFKSYVEEMRKLPPKEYERR
jgi:hypothetical protein